MKNPPSSPGSPSLEGWHYQCDVSVWFALDLVLAKGVASRIQLEPASQEDAELEIDTPTVASKATVEGQTLVVQAKYKGSGHWNAKQLRDIASHGKARPSALSRLTSASVKYVLVTSAAVSPEFDEVAIESITQALEQAPVPAGLLQPGPLAGSFSVLAKFPPARVHDKCTLLLSTALCVPLERQSNCLQELRTSTIERMRTGNIWTQSEIAAVVLKHGGIDPRHRADDFVEPTCWQQIVKQMEERHAVILVGPSGTGKTTIAQRLGKHFKSKFPLEAKGATNPAELHSSTAQNPTIFLIDDPWGRYDLGKTNIDWAHELANILPTASSYRRIVVTTREDIFKKAVGNAESSTLNRWIVHVSPSHYEGKLMAMYSQRVNALANGVLKTAALSAQNQVLKSLQTPLELSRFFERVKHGPSHEEPSESFWFERIVNETLKETIEQEVEHHVDVRNATEQASIVWGIIAATGGIDRLALPKIIRALRSVDRECVNGLEDLVNSLVASGNLRQPQSKATYAHPRVEQGLVNAMRAKPTLSVYALEALLTTLAKFESSSFPKGVEAAAKLVQACVRAEIDGLELPEDTEARIDGWLEECFLQGGLDISSYLHTASTVGSERSVPAQVARWLVKTRGSGFADSFTWDASQPDDYDAETVKGHPLTKSICEAFVCYVFPHEMRLYSDEFPERLERLAGSTLFNAWRKAAESLLDGGHGGNMSMAARAAMRHAPYRKPLLEAALEQLPQAAHQEPSCIDWSGEDGHYNGDYADFYDDEHQDPLKLVQEFVKVTRRETGWSALAPAAQNHHVSIEWADEIGRTEASERCDAEIEALYSALCATGQEERIWRLTSTGPTQPLRSKLRARLFRVSDFQVGLEAAVQCALTISSTDLFEAISNHFSCGRFVNALELVYATYSCARSPGGMSRLAPAARSGVSLIPSPLDNILSTLCSGFDPRKPISREATLLIRDFLPSLTRSAMAHYLKLWVEQGSCSSELVENSMFSCDDPDDALICLNAALGAGMWSVVQASTAHQRARPRALAFKALTKRNGGAIPPDLYQLAYDESSHVRRAFSRALKHRADIPIEIIIELCRDTWSQDTLGEGEHQDYPIASNAAWALARTKPIPDEFVKQILSIASSTQDREVSLEMLVALFKNGSVTAQTHVLEAAFTLHLGQLTVQSAKAAAAAGTVIDPKTMAVFNQEWFSNVNPNFAACAAMLIGRAAGREFITTVGTWFKNSSDRRALLVALASGALTRGRELVNAIADMLPPSHPAAQMFYTGEGPLKSDALDDLGDIRVVNAVIARCGSLVDERPALTLF